MKSMSIQEAARVGRILVPKRTLVRARTLDHLTFDQADPRRVIDEYGTQQGHRLPHPVSYRTADGKMKTVDSTGAFLVGELERLDQTLHMPLMSVTWARDIDLREDVTIADEISSFSLTTFASAGDSIGLGNNIRGGKAWIGKSTDQITGVDVDMGKTPQPLRPWAKELKFTILELESAARMGRPIDDQKYESLKFKHQMDVDAQVYAGDRDTGDTGLVNNAAVTNISNVPNGALGSPLWTSKTPGEILADVNALIQSTWAASGWAVMPSRVGLPPSQYGYISTQPSGVAANQSILKYLLENNVLNATGKGTLEIVPMKWLIGAGVGGTIGVTGTVDRMMIYTKRKDYVRYPMTLLQRTPVQYDSIYHKSTYYCRLGVVEVVYPETIGYRDGL